MMDFNMSGDSDGQYKWLLLVSSVMCMYLCHLEDSPRVWKVCERLVICGYGRKKWFTFWCFKSVEVIFSLLFSVLYISGRKQKCISDGENELNKQVGVGWDHKGSLWITDLVIFRWCTLCLCRSLSGFDEASLMFFSFSAVACVVMER